MLTNALLPGGTRRFGHVRVGLCFFLGWMSACSNQVWSARIQAGDLEVVGEGDLNDQGLGLEGRRESDDVVRARLGHLPGPHRLEWAELGGQLGPEGFELLRTHGPGGNGRIHSRSCLLEGTGTEKLDPLESGPVPTVGRQVRVLA